METKKFWNTKTYTSLSDLDTFFEKKDKLKEFAKVQEVVSISPSNTKSGYLDILTKKAITANNAITIDNQSKEKQLNSLLKDLKNEGVLSTDDDLSGEAESIQKQIDFESQIKFLQTYYDAYMSPKVSDINWRLGKVKKTVLYTPGTNLQFNGNAMYTRSSFAFPMKRKYWEMDLSSVTVQYTKDMFAALKQIKYFTELYSSALSVETTVRKDYNLDKVSISIEVFEKYYKIAEKDLPLLCTDLSDYSNLIIEETKKLKSCINENVVYTGSLLKNIELFNKQIKLNIDNNEFSKESGILEKDDFYSNLFFPPYKISYKNSIEDRTLLMPEIKKSNPGAEFDLDSFLITKQGFTYRQPAFKSISDYINYLQQIIEGATGIVHTYLTEWDLSLYMQQNLLSGIINGGPSKLYLNYRIKQDNPLSSSDELEVTDDFNRISKIEKYTDDRALVFNVAGSAVSKLEKDNDKLWRPSDYPLSCWWMPYVNGKHWNISVFHSEDEEEVVDIKYMDIYDNVNSSFPYDQSNLKDIFKNQDYLGAILGTWPHFKTKYYQAFYTTPMDSHTDWDVLSYGELQKVAGADYGEATKNQKDLAYFINKAKEEMLLNGGISAEHSPAGQRNRSHLVAKGVNSGKEKLTMSKIKKQQDESKERALNGVDLDQPFDSGNKAKDMLSSGLNNKVDASSMTNFTGINRFSPVIFGGPHGSEYNPNTVQAWFDVDSTLLRNIPRVDPSLVIKNKEYYKSTNKKDYFSGLNSLYGGEFEHDISPAKGLEYLVKGLTSYVINYRFASIEKFAQWVPVENFDNVPEKTPWGEKYYWFDNNDQRLVELSDKRIFKIEEKLKPLVDYENGIFRYRKVKHTQYYRRASYNEKVLVPFKDYIFYDKPNLKWEIVQHKFEQFKADLNPAGDYWREIKEILVNPTPDYKEKLVAIKNKYNPLFVLKFWQNQDKGDNHLISPEKELIDLINEKTKNNQPLYLYFLQGNEYNRYETGPDCIFRAPLYTDYYKDVQENFRTFSLFGFKRKRKTGESYKWHPFIVVDITNAEIIGENLQFLGFSNKNYSGSDIPIHLKSNIKDKAICHNHILQKFKLTNTINRILSYKSRKETSVSNAGFWVSLASLILGPVIALASAVISIIATTVSMRKKDKTYDDSLKKNINWMSSSYHRLSGIGIVSNIQGLNTDAEDIGTINFKEKINIQGKDLYNTPFKNLPINFGSCNTDKGMQKALLNLYLRPKFKLELGEKLSYNYVYYDTPVRNFLSILLTQFSYYKFIQTSLIGESQLSGLVNFDVLYETLTTCVDKCVLKANGLNSKNELVRPDKNHVLYDYWMEQIIILLKGSSLDRQQVKTQITNELQSIIDIYQESINTLDKICVKNIQDWTFNDIITSHIIMKTIKKTIKVGNLEKFLFGYLRILYYYRFFFIAKRFNKENGTMWIMRALESVINFIVPDAPYSGEPNSPVSSKENIYNVSFYELQNTTEMKTKALISGDILDPDRITKIYVKVQWCEKEDYDKWQNYLKGSISEKPPEVVQIIRNEIPFYAYKPADGFYTLISREFLKNEENILWNNSHPLEDPRLIEDYDLSQFFISWEDSKEKTPITWNIFGEVNVNNLLHYAKESISPDEYMCLIEQGADFWTISIPENVQPRKEGYQSKIQIKEYTKINVEYLNKEPSVTVEGPFAFTVYPITLKQERPYPGAAGDNPALDLLNSN